MPLRVLICLLMLGALLALPFYLRREEKLPPPAPDADVVVVISSHNKSIRDEYERAFRRYYREKFGRDVRIDFRAPGGSADITRYINDRFTNSFRIFWESDPARGPWREEYGKIFNDPAMDSNPVRRAFLASDTGIGIDVFAGGGVFEHRRMAKRGYAVDGGVARRHPEYLAAMPESFGGDRLYDPRGRYYGVVLSTFGIFCNRDRMRELSDSRLPERWADLAAARFYRKLALADPSKSGSANKCFEIMIQQCMAERGDPEAGWRDGINLLKRIFANARNVTESAAAVVADVANGEAAAGTAIDTYGFSEEDWSVRRFGRAKVVYIPPRGGTAVGADPVQILRGAPHRKTAEAFVDFLLSPAGQKLHCFVAGAPGGPVRHTLNRPPVRRDLYAPEFRKYMFRPDYDPYASGADFRYRPEWTGKYYTLLSRLIKSIMLDPWEELQDAWGAIIAAGGPDRVPEAMRRFNRLPFEYRDADRAVAALLRSSPAEAAAVLRRWTTQAAADYRAAAQLAREGR